MANTRTATRGVQSPPGSFFGSASNGGANGGFGVIAAGGNSVSGVGGFGIEATAGSGFPNGYAGAFNGNVSVSGNLSKTSGSFKIDHPLDPTNKYLYHSFVESPDMMNIYNGNVVLDANGEAVVGLPDWFGALNRDFRYQLTCIGGFAPVYMPRKSRTTSSRSRGIFTALNAVAVVLRLCCGLKLASATTPLFTHRKRTFYEPQRSPFVGAERQPRHIYDAALLITGTRALSESDFRQPPKPGYRTHSAAQLADGHVLGNETTQEKPVAGVRRRSEWALMAGWACRWLTAGSCSALVLPGAA